MRHAFTIGQSVRINSPLSVAQGGGGDFVIVRRNDLDSDEPNYVIESATDRRLRREPHSRLTLVGGAASAKA